jgi:hypothetical protein
MTLWVKKEMPTGLVDCIVHFFMFYEELLVMVHLDALRYPDAVPYQDVVPHHNTLPYITVLQYNVSGRYTFSFNFTNCQ